MCYRAHSVKLNLINSKKQKFQSMCEKKYLEANNQYVD